MSTMESEEFSGFVVSLCKVKQNTSHGVFEESGDMSSAKSEAAGLCTGAHNLLALLLSAWQFPQDGCALVHTPVATDSAELIYLPSPYIAGFRV